ncbi:hypothetical protein RHMOL_Rhmol10G0097900 [Rhododendron molle]|uniref:Uncharacterized protein n=1 Tax=Rhododendron molle TaxID=49168 RepID=A0ACC0M0L6_RHOML|nr:hypothetical protein RHMOL_Rhmol10G0097900 [Rhododendron molle]
MGNIIGGGRKKAKVMKINGEIFKIKIPARTLDVVSDYPGHVLLESKSVERFGIRAKPLEPQEALKPKKIYFLVELPKLPREKVPTRAPQSAKDWLLSSCRSVSDLEVMRPIGGGSPGGPGPSSGPERVKLRLPKSQLDKMVEESRDEAEVAEKIMDLYREKAAGEVERDGSDEHEEGLLLHKKGQWRPALGRIRESFGPGGVSLL